MSNSDRPSEESHKLKCFQCPAVYMYSVFRSLCERHGTKTQGATGRLAVTLQATFCLESGY